MSDKILCNAKMLSGVPSSSGECQTFRTASSIPRSANFRDPCPETDLRLVSVSHSH